MARLSTRSIGRRLKSAKARNRGKWAPTVQRALWGFGTGVSVVSDVRHLAEFERGMIRERVTKYSNHKFL
jgi:hypothetical protein